jgi:hypothetical protein
MEAGGEGLKDKISSRGTDALGDLAQALADNPLFSQALQVAFDARERVNEAGAHAMRNLNVPTAADVDRLGRRLRAVSERLEAVEDKLDQLGNDLVALRRLAERENQASSGT